MSLKVWVKVWVNNLGVPYNTPKLFKILVAGAGFEPATAPRVAHHAPSLGYI